MKAIPYLTTRAARNLGRAALLVASVSALATSAWAQGAPEQTATTGNADATGQDIVVTARKRDERISEVPIAIQAFSEKEIQRYATQSFSSLGTQVPGLSIGNASQSGSVVVTLRGIGAGVSSATLDQAVAVNLDGLQVSQANLLRLGFHDMERIEVLKGPQALFYGKNSPGGVISLISSNPGENFEARVRTGYEIYAKQKFVEGMVSTPLTDGLGLRLVGYMSDQDGWFRNLSPNASHDRLPGRKDYFGRGTLRYAPGNGFENTLKVSYSKSDSDIGVGSAGQLFACPSGHSFYDQEPTIPCKVDRNTKAEDLPDTALAISPLFKREPATVQTQLAIVNNASVEIGDNLSLASVTTYFKGYDHFNENVFGLIPVWDKRRTRQFTQELRATSSYDGPVNFMAGAFYQKNKFRERNFISVDMGAAFFQVPNGIQVPLTSERFGQDTKAYSVFGQLMFAITPQLDFNIGGRYSHETKKVFAEAVSEALFDPVVGPLLIDNPKSSFNNFSPELTLRYRPSQDFMAYASYKHGFVSGGYNLSTTASRLPFDQETVKGVEVGVKGALLDRQLRFDLAAYHYKYKDLQLSSFDAVTFGSRVSNAAGAKSYGIDFSLEFRPQDVPGLSLRAALAWNHSRYGAFKNASCYTGQTVEDGCNLAENPDTGAFQSQDLSGHRLTRAADWAGNIGATYETEISQNHVVSVSADGAYKSSYDPMLEADPRAKQKSSWLLNAAVALRSVDNGWEFAVIGKNLTNELRISEANSAGLTGGGTGTDGGYLADLLGQPTDPRSVMFQITLRDNLLRN